MDLTKLFLFKFLQDNLGNLFNRQIGTQIQESTQPLNSSSKPNCPQTKFVTEFETKFKQIFFDTKSKRHKKQEQEQEQKHDKNKNKNETKTQTRT